MQRSLILAGLALVGLALSTGPTGAGPGPYHQDDRLGYKIRPPQDWTSIPIKADEQWIAAKFLSDKAYVYTDKTDGMSWDHKPEMTVIAFVSEIVKKRGAEVEKTEDGVLVQINNPYTDYQDYLRKTYSGGGWFVAEEKERDVEGVAATCYEIKVEKLAYGGPRRIITWVFHTPEVDYAVQFEVLEDAYKKLRNECYGCLGTFRLVPRTSGSLAPATTGGIKIVDEGKMSPEERRKHREQHEAREHEDSQKNLPPGWKVKQMGRFLVVDHTGDNFKHAAKVVAQLEVVWKWLDDNLGYVGSEEYVPQPIVRLCEDQDEESAFLRSGGWTMGLEIVSHKDRSAGSASWEFEYINTRMYRLWFTYRDRDLYWALPYWLDWGLEQVIGTARAKGRGLEFQPDEWEKEGLRNALRDGTVTRPSELMKMGREAFRGSPHRPKEAGALVRFFVDGAAARNRRTKDVLETYLTNLRAVITEIEKEAEKKSGEAEKAPETEEEEEARLKARAQGWKEKEKRILDETFQRTFGDWTDADWKSFESVYYKAIGG